MFDRISRWLALAGLIGFLLATGSPVHAGNLEFLSKSPVSYFNDEDMRLLKETVAQVLDDEDANAKKSWSNPATGNSGEVESTGAFKTAAGVTCKRVRVTNHAKAVDGQGSYVVCQDADKGWAVDQTAKPG
jgi:surface antigen